MEKEAEESYSRATKAELRKDWDQAFQLYVRAAELNLHISRSTADQRIRSSTRENASKALGRAEKIKEIKHTLAPVTANPFSKHNQYYVLNRSSRVNNLKLPLWDDPPINTRPNAPFVDPDGQPALSEEQRKCYSTWASPTSALPGATMTAAPGLLPHEIIQHIITDCSVCASISVCLEHIRRFDSKLALSSIHPQTPSRVPSLSENGRYDLRIMLNGAYRRIVVDDKLPFSSSGRLACISTGPKCHLWPCIIEKAYMKLMGGYDFPGSNSCIDLHVLAGWIPEYVEIRSPMFCGETTWSWIISSFPLGRCVLTLGTDSAHERGLVRGKKGWSGKLLPAHSYAVIDVRESPEDGERALTVLDSWTGSSGGARVMNVTWDDVCEVFHAVCLSWDPASLGKSLEFHGLWKTESFVSGNVVDTEEDDRGSGADHHLRVYVEPIDHMNPRTEEVWVLLTRHVKDTWSRATYISLSVHVEEDDVGSRPLMTSFDMDARKGSFTNSPHVMIRQEISPLTKSLSIITSYDARPMGGEAGYTVNVYPPAASTYTLSWDENVPKSPYTSKIEGRWTTSTAGGSFSFPTFMLNPQYRLRIQAPARPPGSKAALGLWLKASREVPLNLTLLWSQGERIFEFSKKDVAASSGPYSYGVARIIKDLPAGEYTLVASAFDPSHMGNFTLRTECSFRFELDPIPQEGAGMYSKTIRGAWDATTAMGAPSFKHYSMNPVYTIELPSLTQLKIRLQLEKYDPTVSLNITLFSSQQDSLGRQLATSGPYSDAVSGVAITQVTLATGKYFFVPSTYSPDVYAAFRIIVHSTTPGITITRR